MHGFDDDDSLPAGDEPEVPEGSGDGLVWQLLQLINPGDDDLALQEFAAWRDGIEAGDIDPDSLDALCVVIDWRSGFRVAADDVRGLVEVLDELATRWNLRIDWGGDVDDDEFLADQDVPSVLATAHEALAEAGYALWVWVADGDAMAGWMTRVDDGEAMAAVANALGIDLRPGSDAG